MVCEPEGSGGGAVANGVGQVEQNPFCRTVRSGRRASVGVVGKIMNFLIRQLPKSDGV